MIEEAEQMCRAAVAGHAATVRTYLDAGVLVDAPCVRGYTALHHAGWYGHSDLLGLLLDRDANVHARNAASLCQAAERGYADAVRLLLQAGADPNERYGNGNTPVIVAVRHVPVLTLLVNARADVNAANVVHGKALLYAAIDYYLPAVHFLVEHGATAYMPTEKEKFLLTVLLGVGTNSAGSLSRLRQMCMRS